jgi:uncharacterized protein (DUF2141 family)
MKFFLFLILAFLLLNFKSPPSKTGALYVDLEGLPKGAVAVALYKSADGFPYNFNKAYKVRSFNASAPEMSTFFDSIPYGTYAVSVKWDEFYIRPDTLPMACNHMQGFASSGKDEGKFKTSAFAFKKKEQRVTIKMFKMY